MNIEDFQKWLIKELIYACVIVWSIVCLVFLVGWIMGAY